MERQEGKYLTHIFSFFFYLFYYAYTLTLFFSYFYILWECSTVGGYCHLHIDQHSIINGLFHLGIPDQGGTTMFYSTGKCGCGLRNIHFLKNHTELVGICHRHCQMLLAPFSKVVHGGTSWSGFRAILGCYVDQRTLEFSLKFSSNLGIATPRSKENFNILDQIYSIVVQEPTMGSEWVLEKLRESDSFSDDLNADNWSDYLNEVSSMV